MDTTAETNPWTPWGLILTRRDGYPVLTETAFWQLQREHPEAIERVAAAELYLHLDRPYRVIPLPDRSFSFLVPAPGRVAPAAGSARDGA